MAASAAYHNVGARNVNMGRRDPDFYIEDGNIALSVKDLGDEQNTMYFRLHMSILSFYKFSSIV
ncbi:hypothetical protein C8R47DRAFT_1211738 [Mycena vitilis]|nr:hypothetical protein C8R47DRAFT_1211738 [Mycena vitilis]